MDKIWLRCATGGCGREGTIPSANVAPVVEIGMHGDGTRIFVADSEFQPEEEGDLRLARGAIVIGGRFGFVFEQGGSQEATKYVLLNLYPKTTESVLSWG